MQFALDGPNPTAEWDRYKFKLGLEFPNLPYFTDGSVKITETLAIHQYIAEKWDASLLGTTAQERAKAFMMGNIVMDLKKNVTGP